LFPNPEQQTRPSHVLVVEDEAALRAIVAEELRSRGLIVIEAVDADEAWAYFESGGSVDVVFSDVQMPGSMNGLDLARRLNAFDPYLKIIITSGRFAPREGEEIHAFLPKPYLLDHAVAAILAALEARRRGGVS
jgi:CheY-like chemotaxis protein